MTWQLELELSKQLERGGQLELELGGLIVPEAWYEPGCLNEE